MRKIIVRTVAPRGQEPVARFFNTRQGNPAGAVGNHAMAAVPVDERVLRSLYGGDSAESSFRMPRAAWTIRVHD